MQPDKLSLKLLISEKKIKKAVKKLANQLYKETKDQPVVMIGILNAGAKFLLDLVDAFPNKTERLRYDFLTAKSMVGTKSQGFVTVSSLISSKLADRVIILVDSICDSGRTLEAVTNEIKKYKPQKILTCTLLKRKGCKFPVDYYGFIVPKNKFTLGYGTDLSDAYRWLPDIHELKQ